MDIKQKLSFDNISLTSLEPVNSLFSKAKAFVMYHGDNRNKSSMSKNVVETAIPTLYGCPVIGEYIETVDDFGTHGGKIEISSEGVKYIQTTRPYGFVSDNAPTWETVIEADGTTHEYLTCEVLLWTSRYPEIDQIFTAGKKNQSMEIENVMGECRADNYFEISSFTFSALCVLGDNVEPCFESASVTAYSLDKDEFRKEFDLMIKEFKDSLIQSTTSTISEGAGGAEMNLEENKDTEDFEEVSEQGDNTETEENVETPVEQNEFALTAVQMKDEIRRVLRSETYTDEWGWECRSYWYVDHDDASVYAEDSKQNFLVSMPYTINGDAVAIDFSAGKRVKITYQPFEDGLAVADTPMMGEFTSIERKEFEVEKAVDEKSKEFEQIITDKDNDLFEANKKLVTLTEDYKKLESDVKELREYKKSHEAEKIEEEKEQIFSEFSVGLTAEEMEDVKNRKEDLSVDDITKELNAIFTAKNLAKLKKEKFSAKESEQTTVIEIPKKENRKSKYAV